ncbi:FAD-dependent thymidylate synthase [Heliophilum fasciatum]|uniref:Thymidylate synthase Thy1 n=1 Tax=Heliophilum fasciatum TaxID=35700 RepID=A0A4R2RN49_9FIRM|nr:FAD-dependent thymidylate synthase [Heliophilum fasciatum]MCW2279245.1 hypothetical protein [Heliophilum fasciatum]TCP60625.1 thymidylate synthase Thy1 [Heliophilum fasciatum]
MRKFTIDIDQIAWSSRVCLDPERIPDIRKIEHFINENFVNEGDQVRQYGRVIVLRSTDKGRKASAFASALYLGRYDDMGNTDRFLHGMVRAGHSYEPIRGESVSFLYIGVGKPTYDQLVTYTIRNRRIAGGFRANKPWGYVIPTEARDTLAYSKMMEAQLARCEQLRQESNEPLQAIRSLYPMGVMMPPFMLDFSEEALAKHVFKQRLWERGTQGETWQIVNAMFEAVRQLDPEKWETLREHHAHSEDHRRAMFNLREQRPTLRQLLAQFGPLNGDLGDTDVYDLLMGTMGKREKTMWEKAS